MKQEFFNYTGIFAASEVLDLLMEGAEITIENKKYSMTNHQKSYILCTYKDKERKIEMGCDISLKEFISLFDKKFIKAKVPVEIYDEPLIEWN